MIVMDLVQANFLLVYMALLHLLMSIYDYQIIIRDRLIKSLGVCKLATFFALLRTLKFTWVGKNQNLGLI